MVEEHVVGVGTARLARRAAQHALRAVDGMEVGAQRRARSGDVEHEARRVRLKAEEVFARREAHVGLRAQQRQVRLQEHRHRLARNHLGRPVEALERLRQHLREAREDAVSLHAIRPDRPAPHHARLAVHEEAVMRGVVRERQLRVRAERDRARRLVEDAADEARHGRAGREHFGDVEEVRGLEQDFARRRAFADVLEHGEQVLRRAGEMHARRRAQLRIVRKIAPPRAVVEREACPHAVRREVRRERLLVPRERKAHRHAVRRPPDVVGGVDVRGAARGPQFLLVLLLRLRVGHAAHEAEADRDHVRAHHPELLVRAAGTVRRDAPVVVQREARRHRPAVRLRDPARRRVRGGVPVRPRHLVALGDAQRLVEDFGSAPANENLVCQVFRCHTVSISFGAHHVSCPARRGRGGG